MGSSLPLPELTLLDGSRFRVADADGHVLVPYGWASWCPFCAQQSPLMDTFWLAHRKGPGHSGRLRRAAAQALTGKAQSLLGSVGHHPDFRFANQLDHDLRIEETDDDPARRLFAEDHLARQQQPDVRHCCDGLMGKRELQAPRIR
jgi:hypothetical protein